MRTLEVPSPQSRRRDVRHLSDFTANRRMLVIAVLAAPIGAASAAVAGASLRLIGLVTSVVFYGRVRTTLVAPGSGHHNAAVVLFAPVAGWPRSSPFRPLSPSVRAARSVPKDRSS